MQVCAKRTRSLAISEIFIKKKSVEMRRGCVTKWLDRGKFKNDIPIKEWISLQLLFSRDLG